MWTAAKTSITLTTNKQKLNVTVVSRALRMHDRCGGAHAIESTFGEHDARCLHFCPPAYSGHEKPAFRDMGSQRLLAGRDSGTGGGFAL
jgi:hypothetical protein